MTTTYEQLGELYLETLCQDAYFDGGAGSIVTAIDGWYDVLDVVKPAGSHARKAHLLNAACVLTRRAMGFLERTISGVSRDLMDQQHDWAAIDNFWESADQDFASQEHRLLAAASDAGDAFLCHRKEEWSNVLLLAHVFLKAAALLLKEVQE